MTPPIHLRGVRLPTVADPCDVLLADGVLAAIGPDLHPPNGARVYTAGGRVLLPAFADAHVHLDKTFTETRNEDGTLTGAIRLIGRLKKSWTREDVRTRASRAIHMAVRHGTTAMRTHVDIDADLGLHPLEAILELREELRGRFTLQVVALGLNGTGGRQRDAVREALRLGVDAVGGCPALSPDPQACIDEALALALEFDRPVDLHVDETTDPAMLSLELLAETVHRTHFPLSVTAGHCSSLASLAPGDAARVIGKVRDAGIHIVALPSCNLVLLGRGAWPPPRGLTRIADLRAAGVTVAVASDNVRDPFNQLGRYDMLQIANLAAHAGHLTALGQMRDVLAMITSAPADVMGLPSRVLEPGAPADVVLLDVTDPMPDTLLSEGPPVVLSTGGGHLLYDRESGGVQFP